MSRVARGHCTIVMSLLCLGVCPFGSCVRGAQGGAALLGTHSSGHRLQDQALGRPDPHLAPPSILRCWAWPSPSAAYVEIHSLGKLPKCVGYIVPGTGRALWNLARGLEPAHPAPGLHGLHGHHGHFPEACWALCDHCHCCCSDRPPEVVTWDYGCSRQGRGLTEWICGPGESLAACSGLGDARCSRALLEFLW